MKKHETKLSSDVVKYIKQNGGLAFRIEGVGVYGIPDIFCAFLNKEKDNQSFFIEMKQENGRISDRQIVMSRDLYNYSNHRVLFPMGKKEAIEYINMLKSGTSVEDLVKINYEKVNYESKLKQVEDKIDKL